MIRLPVTIKEIPVIFTLPTIVNAILSIEFVYVVLSITLVPRSGRSVLNATENNTNLKLNAFNNSDELVSICISLNISLPVQIFIRFNVYDKKLKFTREWWN